MTLIVKTEASTVIFVSNFCRRTSFTWCVLCPARCLTVVVVPKTKTTFWDKSLLHEKKSLERPCCAVRPILERRYSFTPCADSFQRKYEGEAVANKGILEETNNLIVVVVGSTSYDDDNVHSVKASTRRFCHNS